MKTIVLFAVVLVIASASFGQPLTGNRQIPSGYPTISAAIADLNANGVGSGGVIFNVAANHTETFSSPSAGLITATGTSSNPIYFRKSGTGANPLITAGVGTSTGTDGIIKIAGGDYITFDGIDLAENVANTNPTTQMEWGYALVKASAVAPFDGCQYVTIKNCSISLNKANTGSVGIYSGTHTASSTATLSLTAPSDAMNNCKFFNNLTTNVYIGRWLKGLSNGGVGLYDTNNEIGVDGGETISNYGGGSATAYGIYAIYQAGLKVANNVISGGTGTSTLYGIFISAGASADIYNNAVSIAGGGTTSSIYGISNASGSSTFTCNIYDNTVAGCSYPTATSGAFYGIYNSGTPATLNLYSNSVNNNTLPGTGTFTGIDGGSPDNLNMYSNTVNNNTKTGSGTFYCTRAGTSVISLHDNTIHANNISTTGAGTIYGYYNFGSPTVETHYNNQIYDLNISGSTTGSCTIYGMYTYTTPSELKNWFLNTIWNLSVTTAGSGTIYCMYSMSGATIDISRNRIYGISACGASGLVYGIYLLSGTIVNICNNMVGDLQLPAANAAIPLAGIYISGGITVNACYNTVYLNSTSTGALFGSAALYASTTPVLTLRNNIFVNTSTPKGSGITAAYRRNGTMLTSYGPTSNNNCFYAGTPSATTVVYYDGTAYQTLPLYQALVAPRDNLSVTESPSFVSTVSPVNLHINTIIPTILESRGAAITGYNNDYDNDIRQGSAGYSGTGTAPDIGADEFEGICLDLNPPVISYVPLLNTSSAINRNLTATITDMSGVPVSGPGMPVLYWKINAGSYIAASPVYLGSNQYQFSFGSGVTAGDVVYYYIVARDMCTLPNIGSFPSDGASGFTYDPPAAATPPSSPGSYAVLTPLSGDYLVGAGLKTPAYTTITAAVADLNQRGVSAPVRFLLQDAAYATETYPIIVKVMNDNNPTATKPVTIKPANGVTSAITGASANSPVFSIRSSYITIDGSNTTGGTSRDLAITNSSATGPRVVGISSAGTTPVVGSGVKNCNIINGSTSASAIVTSAEDGSPGYFNNITIQNNSVQTAYAAIYNIAAAVPGNGSGLLVANNDLNATGAGALRLMGIYVQGVDGATVTGNNIGNISNVADASDISGIWLSVGTINSTISGNTITNLSGTASAPRGIAVSPGVSNAGIMVSGNTVNTLTSASTGTTFGIYVYGPASGVTIQNNRISNIKNTNTTECGADGIGLASTLNAAAMTVKNNFIWDIAGYGYNSLTIGNGCGIEVSSGGGYNLYFNSISLSTNQAAATGLPACLLIGPSVTAGGLDIRNNIFSISATVGTNRYAVICNAPATVFATIDYNDYNTSGPNLCYLGSNILNLAAWQTATGKDLNSVSGDPAFTAAGNLHIQPCVVSPVRNAGVSIASVPVDIDGNTRGITPDIGAAEDGYVSMALAGTPVNISCHGLADGSISTVVSNGCAPYGYAWSNGATAAGITGLTAGSYTVVVTDAAHFVATGSWMVNEPTALSCSLIITNVFCGGGSSGIISANASGGTPGYGYLWSNSATTQQADGLIPGTYTVTVTDSKGCSGIQSGLVIDLGYPCSVSSVVFDGFTYAANSNTGMVLSGDSLLIANVGPGSFGVQMSMGPSVTFDTWYRFYHLPGAKITWGKVGSINNVPGQIISSSIIEQINDSIQTLTCNYNLASQLNVAIFNQGAVVHQFEINNGTPITYQVSEGGGGGGGGGSGPWPGGGGLNTHDHHETNVLLVFEKYYLNNMPYWRCETAGYTHLQPLWPPAPWDNETHIMESRYITEETHSGILLGYGFDRITVEARYSDPGPIISPVFLNVDAHSISGFVVKRSVGTSASGSTSLCEGGSVGLSSTTATSAGIQWQRNGNDIPGATSTTYNATSNGEYRHRVTTVNSSYLTISIPVAVFLLNAAASTVPVSCTGTNDGSIDITHTGGIPPYGYIWSNLATTQDISGLAPGTYSVTVTDAYSCMQTGNWIVTGAIVAGAFTEDFALSAFPPVCWSKTAGPPTWIRSSAVSGYNTGSGSAFADFFNIASTDPFNLMTMSFDASALYEPVLNFDYAYATYNTEVDKLNVYYSANNGVTWSLLLAMPGGVNGILNTGGTSADPFVPNASQWRTHTLPLPAGTNMLKFTAISAYGNNLYLDDISVSDNSVVPVNNTVQNVSVTGTVCYNAIGTINVADGGTTFNVLSGGSASFIAAQNIIFHPFSRVFPGGYMHAYLVAAGGPYCGSGPPSLPSVAAGRGEDPARPVTSFFTIYPNPTTGAFVLELSQTPENTEVKVEIYGMRGEKLLNDRFAGWNKYAFSLEDQPEGIYFIRVWCGEKLGAQKIIKQ